MTKEDILHLANLARIKLTDKELVGFSTEIESILNYVGQVNDLVTDGTADNVGAVYNVFRADEVTNEPNSYTADILNEMPETRGDFLQVKQILNKDE